MNLGIGTSSPKNTSLTGIPLLQEQSNFGLGKKLPTIKVGRELRFRVAECDRAVERFKRTAAAT